MQIIPLISAQIDLFLCERLYVFGYQKQLADNIERRTYCMQRKCNRTYVI